jgi:hypothetical protein
VLDDPSAEIATAPPPVAEMVVSSFQMTIPYGFPAIELTPLTTTAVPEAFAEVIKVSPAVPAIRSASVVEFVALPTIETDPVVALIVEPFNMYRP